MADFHFLRPFWLLLLLALPLIWLFLRHLRRGDSGWSRLIPPSLLSPLLRDHGRAPEHRRSARFPVTAALAVLTIALAGPAWREAPTPLKQPGDSLVMVLDLSLSMLATDMEPDRLTLAKRKIRDILAAREGSLNGLVVYAGDAHVVTPLTDDSKTIEAMLGVLDPVIMPAPGNRADLGVARAKALLDQGAPGPGRILLITDNIAARYRSSIRDTLEGTRLTLSTLVVGTEEGGPIPLAKQGFIREGGEIVISRADAEALANLAEQYGGNSHRLTLDSTDIRALNLTPATTDDWQETRNGLTVNRWQDDGYWLLWIAVPLMLAGWRRGALVTVALAFLPMFPQSAEAMDWGALWQREDQRAPELIRESPDQAAATLEQPQWRGSAQYRAGDFEQAAKSFAAAEGPQADYNRGNALARAGKLQEAIAAYDQALGKRPKMDDARYNRSLVEKLLQQQQKEQQQEQQEASQKRELEDGRENQQKNQAGQSSDGSAQPRQGSGNQQKQDASEQGNQPGKRESGESGEESSKQPQGSRGGEQPSGEPTNEMQPQAPAPVTETPLTQGQEQWLRRIPDDPGGLLKRKFLQQYQERQTPSDEGDTPW